jgi:hypothetical protein
VTGVAVWHRTTPPSSAGGITLLVSSGLVGRHSASTLTVSAQPAVNLQSVQLTRDGFDSLLNPVVEVSVFLSV